MLNYYHEEHYNLYSFYVYHVYTGSCVEANWLSIYGTITFKAGALGDVTESNRDRLCPVYTLNGK